MSPTRKLLLYGRSGDFRLEASYERAFEQVGWRVERFDANPTGEGLDWWITSRMLRRVTRRSLRLRQLGARKRNEHLVQNALEVRPDLVFLVNGALVMPHAVESIRSAGIPVVVFHPDAPVLGNPNYRPEHLPVARLADACFIWSRKLKHGLEKAGVSKAEYLPFAWDPAVFPYIGEGNKTGPEVIFVGGWDRDREWWLEPVAQEFDLKIWGPGYWGTRTRAGSPLRDSWQGRALRGRDAAEALVKADITLNILRQQNLPDGTNMRTFEVPGAGGFLLATRTAGAAEIYPEGEAGAYFKSPDELLENIKYYLNHPRERDAITRRAHAITSSGHRYVHRSRRILRICQT